MKNTSNIFDGLLVLRCQAGDQKALALLVKRHHAKLCKHAFWYLHDVDGAKDIVQDSWVVIAKKIGRLREPNSFESWAMRIVTRKALDHLRGSKKERERLKTIEFNQDQDAGNREALLKQLHNAILELPVDQQTVLRLFYTQEYSMKEISDILEISVGTVKSRLYHAREKLKTLIKTKTA